LINELSRNKMFNKLQDVLGIEDAEVLIEHLPPVGWADVATKRDLEPLTIRLDSLAGEVRDLRRDFGALRSEMTSQFHTMVFAMMGMMVTLTGLVFAATKLG